MPFPLPYGHRISILSDGHAYYEDMVNPCVDMGEVIPVPDHGRLIDADAIPERYLEVRDLAPTIIPADKEGEA